MESYLKEKKPINLEWLETALGELDNNILNLSVCRSMTLDYPEFKQVVHLPDNKKSLEPLDIVLKTFVKECDDDLDYFLSPEIDHKNMVINIFVLPVVESA